MWLKWAVNIGIKYAYIGFTNDHPETDMNIYIVTHSRYAKHPLPRFFSMPCQVEPKWAEVSRSKPKWAEVSRAQAR
jgi:hypothetical protein